MQESGGVQRLRRDSNPGIDYDDLVYGNLSLAELVDRHPETKEGLAGFLYEIILRRMEIRDKSRSVNSVDVVFNFDSIGFTGTPFIDNYPTFGYISSGRQDDIPGLATNSIFFCFLFVTPHWGNTLLFRSSQQLPRLRLGPSKGFLS